ncbi:MAG: hypothetical protein QW292_04115 [Candidatus Parvarchaeota archaeon]
MSIVIEGLCGTIQVSELCQNHHITTILLLEGETAGEFRNSIQRQQREETRY